MMSVIYNMDMIPEMTTMAVLPYMYTAFTMVTMVTASQRPCENPDNQLTFYYECLGRNVNLCIPGGHLRIPLPGCDGVESNRICVKCQTGYINTYNHCSDCNSWTVCKPDEVEIQAPTSQTDRICGPSSVTSAPAVSPSQCPPCELMVTCPACPECPTVGKCASDNEENSTSDTRSSEDATTPGLNTATPDTLPNASAGPCSQTQSDGGLWNSLTIGLAIAVFFLLILVIVLVITIICLCRQSKANKPQRCPDLENARCNGQDEIRYDKANGTVSGGRIGSGSSGGSNQVHIPAVPSQEQTNALGNGGPSVSDHSPAPNSEITVAEESSKPMATPNEYVVDVHNTPTSNGKEPGVTVDKRSDVATPKKSPASERPKSLKVSTKPLVKRDYDVSGGTPSAQPLLASSTLPGDTMATQTATDVYQQSVLDTNTSSHLGGNAESLQSVSPNSTALHEAPTAPYRESPPTSPSCSAFEKAEGQCGTTSHCNEWHADFVKDNIDVATLIDFFVKLGLQKKDFDATLYDNRSERTREQIRHVIINDFIGKEDDPSIYRLLSALDASGNKPVSREFREKFNVTSCAGS